MHYLILIIGENLKYNIPFLNYIFSHSKEELKEIGDVKFIEKNNKILLNIIEKLTKKYKHILIFAPSDNYATISKILATLLSDVLELKQYGLLAPSSSTKFDKDSFLIDFNGSTINALKADPLNKLPKILLEFEKNIRYFYVFDKTQKEVKSSLSSIALAYEIDINTTQYSKFLTLVRAEEKKFGEIDNFIQNAKSIFNNQIIFEKNPVEFIVKKLDKANVKITCAESCTAGLLASKLGEISGVSNVFNGSLVTYSNEVKHIWLDVDKEVLSKYGAVSGQCVYEMINGAIEMVGANFALAISGIAGPSGGSEEKPVGTVFIGAGDGTGRNIVEEFHLFGDRNYIREESANIALCLLLRLRPDIFFS